MAAVGIEHTMDFNPDPLGGLPYPLGQATLMFNYGSGSETQYKIMIKS